MTFKLYQVTFDASGEVERVFELPPENEQKRTIFVREESANKARHRAETLYSLAK